MTLRVIWFLIKAQFNLAAQLELLGIGRKQKYKHLFLLLIVVALVPFVTSIAVSARALTIASSMVGAWDLPAVLIVSLSQIICVFFGIPHVLSSLYFSKDLKRLKVLPLTPFQIAMGELAPLYLSISLILAVFFWPFAAVTGISFHMGPIFWLNAVLVYLFSPLVPLGLSLLCLTLMMKLTERLPGKDFFRVLSSLIFFAAIVFFQSINANIGTSLSDPGRLVSSLYGYQTFSSRLSRVFPPLQWAARALSSDGPYTLWYSLGFLAASLAFLTVVAAAVSNIVINLSAETQLRRRARAEQIVQVLPDGVTLALLRREHWNLTRTPAFLMTAIMNLMVVPLLLLVSRAATSHGPASLPGLLNQLRGNSLLVPAITGFSGLLVATNQVPSTAVSREGKSFWISRLIPVPPEIQVNAKLLYGMLYGTAQLLVLLISVCFFRILDVASIARLASLSLALTLPLTQIGLLVDLLHPRLQWTHPQQAMKGNYNGLIAGLLGALLVAALAGLFWLFLRMGLGMRVATLAVLPVIGVISAYLQAAVRRLARSQYLQLEF
ncbi:MAG TPA: hypothetical protein GXX40_05375 [Firmicutes bacterium]|nr:hypothetical protein [Bacillota bacterium]